MDDLKQMHCVPCRGDEPRLEEHEIKELKPQVPDWELVEEEGVKRLRRAYKFKDYRETLDFVNRVAQQAEQEDHHPDILFTYNRATVTWWTHAIDGLHRNDFIMAAKTDEQYQSR